MIWGYIAMGLSFTLGCVILHLLTPRGDAS